MLCGCLPGDEDVTERYNRINEAAHTKNVGSSLSQAANAYLAWEKADNLKLMALLGKVQLSFVGSIAQTPPPKPPPGVTVVQCGAYSTMVPGVPADPNKKYVQGSNPIVYGAIAYFNKNPPGVASLEHSGEAMAAALAEHFGADNVGIYNKKGFTYPLNMTDPAKGLLCFGDIQNDIVLGSPIFMTGYRYSEGLLPSDKSLDAEVIRDITIPCTAPLVGVVKREQKCVMHSPTLEEAQAAAAQGEPITEKVKVLIGRDGTETENDVQRLDKKWTCDPDLKGPLPAPTADELDHFCRDPSKNLVKQPDNAMDATAKSLKKTLESNGGVPGYYTYKCQDDGTGNCKVEVCDDPLTCPPPPCTDPNGCPPPKPPACPIELSCIDANIPPLYVDNPKIPLETNAALDLVGEGAGSVRACGRGWNGTMTARYLVRRCDLYATDCHGTRTYKDTKQSIYYIAYAGATCSKMNVSYNEQCPNLPGVNMGGYVPITRNLVMRKPLALEWAPPVVGVQSWTTSNVATNNSRAEVLAEAGQKGFVVPNISQADLNSVLTDDTQWSLKVARGMKSRDPSSIDMDITSCNSGAQTCVPPNSGQPLSGIVFLVDVSPQAKLYGDTTSLSFERKLCTGGKAGDTCNSFMGVNQSTCSGRCDGLGATEYATGASFADAVVDYINTFVKRDLPGVSVITRSGGTLFWYSPTEIEDLGGQNSADYIIIAPSDDHPPNPFVGNHATGYPNIYSFVTSRSGSRFSSFISGGTPAAFGLGSSHNYAGGNNPKRITRRDSNSRFWPTRPTRTYASRYMCSSSIIITVVCQNVKTDYPL